MYITCNYLSGMFNITINIASRKLQWVSGGHICEYISVPNYCNNQHLQILWFKFIYSCIIIFLTRLVCISLNNIELTWKAFKDALFLFLLVLPDDHSCSLGNMMMTYWRLRSRMWGQLYSLGKTEQSLITSKVSWHINSYHPEHCISNDSARPLALEPRWSERVCVFEGSNPC